jgi:hypothetical protein
MTAVMHAPDLQTLHSLMNAWAEQRQTPFGVVVPKIALKVNAYGVAQVPAYGTQVNIVGTNQPANQDYLVQARPNWYLLLCGVVLGFQGQGPAPNPNDVQFTIDVDRPLGATQVGYSEKDFGLVTTTLPLPGISTIEPIEFKHRNGERIRVKATPIANMGTGLGNFFSVALYGYEWPERGFE